MEHNKNLDAVRGCAILLVILAHWASSPLGTEQTQYINLHWFSGWFGVDLFFVLSGYLVSASLDRITQRQTGSAIAFIFLSRRWCRTMGPAFFWLAFWLTVVVIVGGGTHTGSVRNNIHHAIAVLFQYANLYLYFKCVKVSECGVFGYYWSLSLEEWFYVMLLGIFLFRRRIALVLVVLYVAVWALSAPLMLNAWFRIDGMIAGCLIYQYRDHLPKLSPKWVPLLVIALGVNSAIPIPHFHASVVIICSLLVIISLKNHDFYPRWVVWVGKISYSLYLVHTPLIALMSDYGGGYLFLPLMVLLGYLGYRYIEIPCQAFGYAMSQRIEDKYAARATRSFTDTA